MKIKNTLYIFTLIISSTFFVNAKENNNELYTTCKKAALIRREQTMIPALKEYVESSQIITNKAKNEFEKVSWYIDTSYRVHSKKIQEDKKQAMVPVNEKINKVRSLAQNTWKAEDALCEFRYNNGSTTPKKK